MTESIWNLSTETVEYWNIKSLSTSKKEKIILLQNISIIL